MLKAYAHAFSRLQVQLLIRALEAVKRPDPHQTSWDQVPNTMRQQVEQLLEAITPNLTELGLPSSLDQIEFIAKANNWRYEGVAQHLDELRRRIEGELKSRLFLYVPFPRPEYYDQAELFGLLVAQRFPSASDDIVEAGNCFALGRWTATVHQCIGIMQVGLIALARHLKQPIDIHVDTWESIIRKVETGRDARRAKMTKARWKAVESFYAEVISDLRAVKDAWRNPDAHFRRPFNEPQARKALEKVRDFMQNLATRVSERKS